MVILFSVGWSPGHALCTMALLAELLSASGERIAEFGKHFKLVLDSGNSGCFGRPSASRKENRIPLFLMERWIMLNSFAGRLAVWH